jgi:hypothetical protein
LGTDVRALALLSVASCLFTGLLEAGWIWAYQGYEPSEILIIYFTLALGIPSALKILAFGLLIAVLTFIQQAFGLRIADLGARKVR